MKLQNEYEYIKTQFENNLDKIKEYAPKLKASGNEKKIEWLNKATSEELMSRYDLAYYKCAKSSTDNEWEEWLELAREEILNRLSK